ncbi:MAG: endonuclease domain-containing protein [Clostridia bacterium]|nr:endonuclease domain-containing protein [Clostridia bacterium]
MPIEYQRKMIPRAKELRKDMTPQEKRLWYDFLCHYPLRFQRQKVISSFIADFYCFRAKLVVEVDGSQHETIQGKEYDRMRSSVLERYGLKVIRFTNDEVDNHFRSVCCRIEAAAAERV